MKIGDIEKNDLIQKITESYIAEFETYKDKFIENVYKDLIKKDEWYLPTDDFELKKLSIAEMISHLNKSNSLKDLLENLYDGSYSYDWGQKIYSPILEEYTNFSDCLEFIGMPYLDSYISDNFVEEFQIIFKEELEDYDFDDIYEFNFSDIVEDYLDVSSDVFDYIMNPEVIADKWLENTEVNTSKFLKKFLNKNNLKDNSLLKEILKAKANDEFLDELKRFIGIHYIDYLSLFIFDFIEQDLKRVENNIEEFKNKVYDYKSIGTLKDFNQCNPLFKKRLKENLKNNSLLFKEIETLIFKQYTKDYIKNNLTKLDDTELKNMLTDTLDKGFIYNLLKVSDKEVNEFVFKIINSFFKRYALHNVDILNLDPYKLYIKAAKKLNKEPSFTVEALNFKDEFLEQNFYDIYNSIIDVYKKERDISHPLNTTDISNEDLIKKANDILNEVIYDRPNRAKIHIENSKIILKELILNNENYNNNLNLINDLILMISKLESYVLLDEKGNDAYNINYKEILNYESCLKEIMKTNFNRMLKTVYVTENIKTQLKETLCENPKDEFPLARSIKRHFIINVGETNTGKTYNSIQRLKESKNGGVYLAPLRLLALEIQEKLNSEGIPCSLSTGEEEDIIDGAIHESITIEKANFNKRYEVCVIDECQMIGDEQRGYAWTNAILGIYSKEIHICVAPEALDIILSLIDNCNDTYEIIEHHRKTPLIFEDKDYNLPTRKSMQSLEKGDALIVFSKRDALTISSQLKSKGISSSVIYGALPYQSRKKQFQLFLNGETDIVVATDSLGMGVNLPIKRVIFLRTKKYDGKNFRKLKHSEVKQISGRAGRQGIYNEGFVNSTENKKLIKKLLEEETPKVNYASLLPPKNIIYIDNSLLKTITVWDKMTFPNLYKKGDTSRFVDILNRLERYDNLLSKEDMYNIITLPFDEKNEEVYSLFIEYLNSYINKDLYLLKPNLRSNPTLDDLEVYYKKLDLYYAFSKKFNMEVDLDWLKFEKDCISNEINEMIINNISNLKKRCPQCGKKLDFTWEHKLCNSCFVKNNNYYDYY